MPQPETDLKTLLEQNGQIETEPETRTRNLNPNGKRRSLHHGKVRLRCRRM